MIEIRKWERAIKMIRARYQEEKEAGERKLEGLRKEQTRWE